MELFFPWLLGFAGLGVGVLAIGGDSYWLFAFGYVPVLCGYWLVWPR